MENCFGKDGACECDLERGSEKDETWQNEIRAEYGTHQTTYLITIDQPKNFCVYNFFPFLCDVNSNLRHTRLECCHGMFF